MKPLKALRDLPFFSLKTRREGIPAKAPASEDHRDKGQNLLRLYEYQHRVIVEIFKVSFGGFLAFTLIMLGFALYALVDPFAPRWMALVIAALSGLLLIALLRTVLEFKAYRKHYEMISARLREKLLQPSRSAVLSKSGLSKGSGEHRLLSALKPKEYAGWDHKSCANCRKAIELMANVCQHCGQEQELLLVN